MVTARSGTKVSPMRRISCSDSVSVHSRIARTAFSIQSRNQIRM